ncbi:hypothetical protein HQ47_09160 [Porphyromonas macacae]|uniref:Uncharacterized protein n=1 Tax=Porphyromonas macacae TaxID=28115 RepID=A0A0A2E6F5_9PORP|nr:hypothetical protein HQ47_09160 [Porphyromonas macacae]
MFTDPVLFDYQKDLEGGKMRASTFYSAKHDKTDLKKEKRTILRIVRWFQQSIKYEEILFLIKPVILFLI